MKLYYFDIAPNPTRVMCYIREKGIDIDTVNVSLIEGEQRSPEHLARNPAGELPVLELVEGHYLSESLSIMEYLEELYPRPVMIGATPMARAHTRSFERQVDLGVLLPVARIVHATRSPLGLPACPQVAEQEQSRLPAVLQRVDERIGAGPFAMGAAPTIVDCTLFAGLQFGEFFDFDAFRRYANISRWYDSFRERHQQ
ncbi:MAG: glutathione transferase [Halioglobus sp.]|nr:glutathione transferase [Halioglobus sp.]MAT92721.1 glutathione transferase [Halioglobus sp.]|tara:strand:- start:1963 stop:2559 length:597 start_codon:yes stop_codon:yes gene_type:complete